MKYSKGFKEQKIKLSDEIEVKHVCALLKLLYGVLADWRKGCNREHILRVALTGKEPITEYEKKFMK